ncbi:hypothetical protein MHI37_03730 [Paenibacillus sp. FSL H8-0548]|uniref:hypothetical protein n=1 Tax=Paenibacillus sp. FSL H8-0548 TaxID=1920422 RepID=UPI00211655B0|nr:hypothetical protein [Paenibacillus sp. FSL H8-0548]
MPNLAARSLVKQKSGLIGILINKTEDESCWQQLRYSQFINRLEKLLSALGYHVVLFSLDASNPKLDIISERKLDGVFVIDVKKENFHLISSHFSVGVPLIVIDSLIDDPLFCKVNYDYKDALAKAFANTPSQQAYLIIDSYNNAELMDYISSSSNLEPSQIHRMTDEASLKHFLEKNQSNTGIILNEFIAIAAAKYSDPAHFTVICTAGCHELVPSPAARISFGNRMPEEAFQLMVSLLDNARSGHPSTFIQAEVISI